MKHRLVLQGEATSKSELSEPSELDICLVFFFGFFCFPGCSSCSSCQVPCSEPMEPDLRWPSMTSSQRRPLRFKSAISGGSQLSLPWLAATTGAVPWKGQIHYLGSFEIRSALARGIWKSYRYVQHVNIHTHVNCKRMHACMCVCMYDGCMYVGCMYVWMNVCMYVAIVAYNCRCPSWRRFL